MGERVIARIRAATPLSRPLALRTHSEPSESKMAALTGLESAFRRTR